MRQKKGLEKYLQLKIVLRGLVAFVVVVPFELAIHDSPSAVQVIAWLDQFQIQVPDEVLQLSLSPANVVDMVVDIVRYKNVE